MIAGVPTSSPLNGVVVRWRVYGFNPAASPANPTNLRLVVVRPAGGTAVTTIGKSDTQAFTFTTLTLREYPTRQPIALGDLALIELTGASSNNMRLSPVGLTANTDLIRFTPPLAEGETRAPTNDVPPPASELTFNADVEPDADADGFGDETQDACPGQTGDVDGCDRTAPDTTIIVGPKSKTKKKKATFEFSGTDARTVAGFECSLDGGAFAACTSPHKVKVNKGKHTLSVRAVDAAGNADASPATDDWKVKRKKKK